MSQAHNRNGVFLFFLSLYSPFDVLLYRSVEKTGRAMEGVIHGYGIENFYKFLCDSWNPMQHTGTI